MRVLFVTQPRNTILMSMVPLAWALRTAGHEVGVASSAGFADEITQAGLTAVPAGRNSDAWSRTANYEADKEEMRPGLFPPWDAAEDASNVQWDYMLQGYVHVVDECHHLENFPLIAPLVRFARQWKPDLVVWEPMAFAGSIAAKACGAAHARILFGIDVFGVSRELFRGLKAVQPTDIRADPLAEWLTLYAGKYGVEFTEDLIDGQFTIDQLPARLQLESDLHMVRTRFVPYGGPATVPSWLWTPPERPRVALTLGSSATDYFDGYTLDVQGILDALADLDIEVVATIAEAEQKKLARIPGNARLVPYVPLHALAPTCSAVINHAGFGTLNTFALHGVPQLTLPYHFDEPIFAEKYAATGAGLQIPNGEATGDNVRGAVLRLLEEPAFRIGAAALRDELAAMPSPNEVVGQLEELTAKYRAGR